MSKSRRIGVIVGSLREGSNSRKLAKALMARAPDGFTTDFVEIGDLPLYNEDLDAQTPVPAAWTRFREKMAQFDAILFVTPEYNRSVPGCLNNAIDVGSRPYGKSVWNGKPAAVISGSAGAVGGFGSNHHLRQSLVFLNMVTLQQPEAYIGHFADLFDETGALTNDKTGAFLQSIMADFGTLIGKLLD